ncbi:hypothetical protein [Phycobacter sp. K97]|uniref:hypothetical protein n=1 Tax=Phycobacter sedimenti TaxID=3133977 RepID=UPI00311FCF12
MGARFLILDLVLPDSANGLRDIPDGRVDTGRLPPGLRHLAVLNQGLIAFGLKDQSPQVNGVVVLRDGM